MHPLTTLADARAGRGRSGVPQMGRVLVVADDQDARDRIIAHLTDHRCAALGSKPADLTRHLHQHPFSLLVLDVRSAPFHGLDMLRSVRACSDVPVIMLAGRRQDAVDRVLALELGADDLLNEPLDLRELLARARAILRRHEMGRHAGAGPARGGYRFESWELRRGTRVLTNPAGGIVPLSRGEYALLVAFLEAPRRPLSRPQLMRAMRIHEDSFDRSIDVQVLRLRRKLEADPSNPRLIRTERGVGYTFDAAVESLF